MPETTLCNIGTDSLDAASIASSTPLFPNAPTDLGWVRFTVRNALVTYRSDDGAVTLGANGIDLQPGSYEWRLNQTEAGRYNVIGDGASASVYIEYYK